MKLEVLEAVLQDLKWRYEVLTDDTLGRVVITERGGRILGIYPHETSENMLWINPKLADRAYVQQHFVQGREWNLGGERTWLSPEVEYNIPNIESIWENYTVQSAIDPGSYSLQAPAVDLDKGTLKTVFWQQQISALTFQSKVERSFHVEKICRLLSDPLQMIGMDSISLQYDYIGYETTTKLKLTEIPRVYAPLSLWTLMQVPPTGEMIVPTYGYAEVTDFFEPTGASHLTVTDHGIYFKIDAKERHKISLKSSCLTGRIGYLRQGLDGYAYLIVRHIQINPSEKYLDVPVHQLNDQGHCVQGYNDSGQFGAFGELEYHTSGIDQEGQDNRLSLEDTSQVWCYRGDRKIVNVIAKHLLGCNFDSKQDR